MKRSAGLAFAALTMLLSGCAPAVNELHVTIGGVTVTAEQATSVEAQREGLSGRDSVPEGTGMWFPIESAQPTEVWMKDTRVPLDVAWRDHDDVAARANETIRREVQDRYGIDVDAAGADVAEVADALRRAEADRAEAHEEQRRAGEGLTASQILLSSAEARDRDADAAVERAHPSDDPTAASESASQEREAAAERSQAVASYDSADRRAKFARSLEGTASVEEVRGRVLADTGNAKSPQEAVGASTSAPIARKTRTSGQERSRGLAR